MSDPKYITFSFTIKADEAHILEEIDVIAEQEGARSRSRVIVRALRFFLLHYSTDKTIPQIEHAEVSE